MQELLGYCCVKDVDQDGNTPLHLACIHGFVDIVELLINNHNADIEAVWVLYSCFFVLFSMLAESYLAFWKLIWYTVIHHFKTVNKISKFCYHNTTYRNTILWTPLGCAASNGHERVVQLLIDAKASINPKDKSRATPLHLASKEGHLSTVNILLKNKADVRSRDDYHLNPLDRAIENGHE